MTRPQHKTARTAPFVIAHGLGPHWGTAAKACLDGLNAQNIDGANLGFLYADQTFAEDLGSILTFLRETTHIESWVGAVAPGICAGAVEYRPEITGGGGGLAVMAGTLPSSAFHTFCLPEMRALLAQAAPLGLNAALIHADPRHPAVVSLADEIATRLPVSVGGLVSAMGPEYQVATGLSPGGFSGILFGPGVELVIGLTQGCSPIGPVHRVTEANNNLLVGLDGRPALDVLKAEAGDLIARDLRRAAGYIHVGMPTGTNGNAHDYAVRSLMGIDPYLSRLVVASSFEIGDPMMFVRRDANSAQLDLYRMVADMKERLRGRDALGALYISCVARGQYMFGGLGVESAIIQDGLDGLPLLGFFANGELAQGRLYSYTGILAVLVAK